MRRTVAIHLLDALHAAQNEFYCESQLRAREAEAERAGRTKPFVVALGARADVKLQAARTLEPGAVSAR